MSIVFSRKRIIGLDVDEGFVVATELIKKYKEIILADFTIAASLKELAANPFYKGQSVIINLPIQVVLYRSFHISSALLSNKNRQKNIAAFLSRQNLPFKLDECYWNTFTLDSNLNFIAAKKELVEKYISQAKDSGFEVLGATASSVALYNALIHAYPERGRDRFSLLNLRGASSELLIYEAKRLWVYPLSIGNRDLCESAQGEERFFVEVQRIFNAHYIQNPPAAQKPPNYLYLCGQQKLVGIQPVIKKALADYEIVALEPLKNINNLAKTAPANQCALTLSLGLGLAYFGAGPSLKINLIEERVRKEKYSSISNSLKKIFSYFIFLVIAALLIFNAGLVKKLNAQIAIYKNTQVKISSVLAQARALNEEKEKIHKSRVFLEERLSLGPLYLKALAAISESKTPALAIKELEAQLKDKRLHIVLSGSVPKYEEINDFLTKIKKNQDVKEAKVVASSFPTLEAEARDIDFKLRFELQ